MIRQADVFLYFVKLQQFRHVQGIILSIGLVVFEYLVDLVEVEYDWRGTQRLPALDIDRGVRGAHLDAVKVLGGLDRPNRTGYLPEPIFEAGARHGINALCGHFLSQVGAEIAIYCLINLSLVAKREGNPLYVYSRNHGANQPSVQSEEIQLAIDEHLQRGGIASRELLFIGA